MAAPRAEQLPFQSGDQHPSGLFIGLAASPAEFLPIREAVRELRPEPLLKFHWMAVGLIDVVVRAQENRMAAVPSQEEAGTLGQHVGTAGRAGE